MNPLLQDVTAHAEAFDVVATAIKKAREAHGADYAVLLAENILSVTATVLTASSGSRNALELVYRAADQIPMEK